MKKCDKKRKFKIFEEFLCLDLVVIGILAFFVFKDNVKSANMYPTLDFSDIDKTYTFEDTAKYGELDIDGYELTKNGDDYVLKLKDVVLGKLVLPKDVADKNCSLDTCGVKPRKSTTTVYLYGNNKVSGYYKDEDGIVGQYVKKTTFINEGTLTVNATHGISIYSDTEFVNGNYNINSSLYGINTNYSLTITGGTYNISSHDSSLIAADEMVINKANITATLNEGNGYIAATKAVIEGRGNLEINNSQLILRNGPGSIYGINVTINNSKITDEGKSALENGISSANNMTITKSNIDLNSKMRTINAYKNLVINGGKYNLKSSTRRASVVQGGNVKITGKAVMNINGVGYGITSTQDYGNVTIESGANIYINIAGNSTNDSVDQYAISADNTYIADKVNFEAFGPHSVFRSRPTLAGGKYYIEASKYASDWFNYKNVLMLGKDYLMTFHSEYRYVKFVPAQDDVAPTIEGATSGKTYCSLPTITVKDNIGIDTITVNGNRIRDFIVDTNKEKSFVIPISNSPIKEIVVTDILGNKETKTITAYNGCGIDINKATITLSSATYTYDGKAKKPIVTVRYYDRLLKENADYTLSYKNNIELGTATVEILGKGGFNGRVLKYFTITKNENVLTAKDINVLYSPKNQSVALNIHQTGNARLTYKSNNSGVTVDSKGTVTIKKGYVGGATITVTASETATYKEATKYVVVDVARAKNVITASNIVKNAAVKNQSFNLGVRQTGDARLTYKSNNKNVTVNASGVVTIAKNFSGKVTITISAGATSKYLAASKNITIDVRKVNNTLKVGNFTKTVATKAQTFKLGVKQSGNASLSYKSDNKNVTVDKNGKVTIKAKFIGQATITITANANNVYNKATKKITVVTNPAKMTISKLTNKKSKKLVVSWKKDTLVTGYIIEYSTDSKFKKDVTSITLKKNNVTSTTISNLKKGKKYYVRIRSYKTVSKINYYAPWSSFKSIKITK